MPHSPHNTLPLVGELSDGLLVRNVVLSVLIVKITSPRAEADGAVGEFVPALAQEFGTTPTDVNPLGFSALFGNRSDACKAANLDGTGEAAPVGPEGNQETRS